MTDTQSLQPRLADALAMAMALPSIFLTEFHTMQIDLSELRTDVVALQALVPLVEAQREALIAMKGQLDVASAKLIEAGVDPAALTELASLEGSLHAAMAQLATAVAAPAPVTPAPTMPAALPAPVTPAASMPPVPLPLPPAATVTPSTTPAPAPSGAPTGVEVAAKPD